MKKTVEEKIAATACAINRQVSDYGDMVKRREKNIWVDGDGRIVTVEDPMELQKKVEKSKKILDDMMRHLTELLKERDGVE